MLVYDIQTHFIENQLKEQHSDTYKSIEHNAQTVYDSLLVNNTRDKRDFTFNNDNLVTFSFRKMKSNIAASINLHMADRMIHAFRKVCGDETAIPEQQPIHIACMGEENTPLFCEIIDE